MAVDVVGGGGGGGGGGVSGGMPADGGCGGTQRPGPGGRSGRASPTVITPRCCVGPARVNEGALTGCLPCP